tara:strand:+ start:178 stop:540 length:363 start_codon:yes stop_codon:yes gene_type:complete
MPCIKCEDGNWRWGESGECKYDSLASCEADNADYSAEIEYDYKLNFTQEQMEKLHNDGEVLIHIQGDEEGEEMDILFTYDVVREEEEGKEKETYDVLTNSLLDDELDEYINKLTNSIKQL